MNRDPEVRRLRVMRVLTRLNVGGPAMQVSTLLRGLDPARFEHRLYTGHVEPGEADYHLLHGLDLAVHHVPTLGRRLRTGGDYRALLDLTAEMRRFRPHIVHTHTAKAGTLGRIAALLTGVPVRVHTFHGHLLHGYFTPAKTRLVTGVEQVLARHTHRLVAVGGQVRDDLLRAGVGRPAAYRVIMPGTALGPIPARGEARRALGLPADGAVIAYVGRVTAIKGPERLIDVARRVHAADPTATLVVCGDGDRLADTRAAAEDLGEAVRFIGWRADVATVYAAADLVVLTSDNEGTPVCLIEAAIAGVAAVATRVGAVGDVVRDGVTGVLCRPDAAELAEAVVRLLGDPATRERMGRSARELAAARFGPDRLVADTDRLYTALAVERGWWPRSALGVATQR
ncbi:glycosyltransferase family 4 protein [Dactylosporangium maewongense]|uniref:Glycosyltransferase family 4 protein n=1 Tax=Dactylosporangium maewongense TaxID=634393 RepID=A0ABN2DAG1_9ACTN